MVSQSLLDGQSLDSKEASGSVSINLIVAHLLCGSIIGKAGANIKEIQAESNAKIIVSRDMLPESNDRIVEIFGVVDAMYKN